MSLIRNLSHGVLALGIGLSALAGTTSAAQATPTGVSGVQFRWGFDNESNNRGAAPGTFNFFSAGRLADPGTGGVTLTNASEGASWSNGATAGWTAHDGNVYVEKLQADNSYAVTTWAGTKTDRHGTTLGGYASNTAFSDHQVVIDNGTGTLDPDSDDADLTWDGDFTVVYYSGYSFFYVSDPHLTLHDGTGTVTATLSGFGSDMNDMTKWEALEPTPVTLATVSGVDVTATGLITTPAYRTVTYEAPQGGTPQVRSGADWGSFPQSFVDFQQRTGQGPYWYSSGGSVDKNKPALPLTVTTTPAAHVHPPVVKTAPAVGVSSPASTYGRTGTVTVAVTGSAGVVPTGTVTLSGAGTSQTRTLSSGRATFALARTLAPGRHAITATYAGDGRFTAARAAATHTVTKAGTARPTLKVTKKPTRKKAGRASIAVRSLVSGLAVTGKAVVTLSKSSAKSSTKRKFTVRVRSGKATAKLPKLTKGTWKVTVTYAGSATQTASTSKASRIRSC